ncbi:hypothetical protein NT6N_25330 [Oceaniferula spumae]|uniref:Imm33-like domain-containing protein n=1 Tax=Oceaniferula spumae TaxID=2979115 RepID=A0AAT9FNE2_9BACT
MEIFHAGFLEELHRRGVKPGETIMCGWLWFRAVEGAEEIELETLDFKAMASFTRDLSAAQVIHTVQQERLKSYGATEEPCNMMQTAFVSKSIIPGSDSIFLNRQEAASESDSGWYVGMVDESRDLEDPETFEHRSLYELTISDDRLASWWLLPVGTHVFFDRAEPYAERVEQAGGHQPPTRAEST